VTRLRLKVIAAQIFTLPDGTAVDSLDVQGLLPGEDIACDWRKLQKDLELAITFRLGLEYHLSKKTPAKKRRPSKNLAQQNVKVNFDNESSESYTIIEVYADDRLGLLYFITRTLSYFQICIFKAKISGHRDQIVDVFYVLDQNNNKITDTSLVKEIQESLKHAALNS